MRRSIVAGLMLLALGARVRGLDGPPGRDAGTPGEQYRAVLEDFERAERRLGDARRDATTDAERAKAAGALRAEADAHARRFLAIAAASPGDTAAVDALSWCVQNRNAMDGAALKQLAEGHARDPEMFRFADLAATSDRPEAEGFLRAVARDNPVPTNRGLALLALGRYLTHRADRIRNFGDGGSRAEDRAWFAEASGMNPAELDTFLGADPGDLEKQAESAFESILRGDGGPALGLGDDARKRARAELREIRELAVGRVAPEIVGADLEGRPLKLSDLRGKVVVVSFWGTWCKACTAQVPREKALAARMEGRPFALVGVDTDSDRAAAAKHARDGGMTWRSWWDGGNIARHGAIVDLYNVHAWPTFYVLDRDGVIRFKSPGTPRAGQLEAAVDALLGGPAGG